MGDITGWAHVGIRVHDLAKARAFYELVGFEFVIGPVGPEPVAILRHPAGLEINLIINAAETATTNVLMDVDVKHPGITHVALEVTSVAAMRERLEGAGHPITGSMNFPNGGKAIFVRDADGNVIEFDEPPPPA